MQVTNVNNSQCNTFNYDSNDRFFIDANGDQVGQNAEQATLEVFEANLTAGDDVHGDYNANPALVSEFILTDEAPAAPLTATATPKAGAENDTVTVTFDDSATSAVDSYNVYRTKTANVGDPCPAVRTGSGDIASQYTLVKNIADTKPTGTYQFDDTGLQATSKYCYAVTSVDDNDESSNEAQATATTLAAASTDSTPPFSEDAVVTTNSGLGGTFDTGDVFQVVFDEPLAAPDAGDTIRATDESGANDTVANFINGTNAAFTPNTTTETVNGSPGAVGSRRGPSERADRLATRLSLRGLMSLDGAADTP